MATLPTTRLYRTRASTRSLPAGTNKNGGFITSCICHGCPWDKLTFEGNKTAYEYYADWANSRDFPRQPKSLVVDSRGPNGDGDLTFSECAPFP